MLGPATTRMDDGDVTLGPSHLHVVLRGTPHRPPPPDDAAVLLVEQSATVDTGDTPGTPTAGRRLA